MTEALTDNPRPAHVLVFGGTMFEKFNAEKKLVPSPEMRDERLAAAGFDPAKAEMPLGKLLDSIDFDIGTHYKELLKSTMKVLDAGETPVICGGTDTLAWYATMLTKDLIRRGYLGEDSGQRVIFLSSMLSPTDDLGKLHVERILKAGKFLCNNPPLAKNGHPLSGGFAICAEKENASKLAVHDVLNDFDKVSSEQVHAFRSNKLVGHISGNNFKPDPNYVPPKRQEPTDERGYLRIAPPLLGGQSNQDILAYMKAMDHAFPPFKGVIIEGMPSSGELSKGREFKERVEILQTVAWLRRKGISVTFCLPLRFDSDEKAMLPLSDFYTNIAKKRNNGLRSELETAGAEIVPGVVKDVYINKILAAPMIIAPAKEKTSTFPAELKERGVFESVARQKKAPSYPVHKGIMDISLRYVPWMKVMEKGIDQMAPLASRLRFSAMPHNVMPDNLYPVMLQHSKDTQYQAAFEYNGTPYVTEHGETKIEGEEESPYFSGRKTATLIIKASAWVPYPKRVPYEYRGK